MYDYVIVGAGSAGCVLAARLSEDPGVHVALLEAGGPDTAPEIHTPLAFPSLFASEWDWDYHSAPEPGLDGRRAHLPRGRVLGGCSSMNAMIYMRGNPADYDAWPALGATGWAWADVLPYFLRAEDNERGASALHGSGGPLSQRRAYDLLVQSETGSCSVTGLPGQPAKPGIPLADVGGAMYAYSSVLAALYERERTGRGAAISVALFDAVSALILWALWRREAMRQGP